MPDLLWLLLILPGAGSFLLLRGPTRSFARVAILCVVSIAWGWAVLYAWVYLTFDRPHEGRAFDSVDYIVREVPSAWLWRYLASSQGWIPGVLVFGLALAAARLWPRREPG
jgi:hypothetical protein